MLPTLTLPQSWRTLLNNLRPLFARRRSFLLFTILTTGMIAATHRRSIVGMLAALGVGATVSFHSACRFFSAHRWSPDDLGITVARLIVDHLLQPGTAITVAVDETMFKRYGPRIHHSFWSHDGSATGVIKRSKGNKWTVAGIVVDLPHCRRPVCLPVLCRLWAGRGTTSSIEFAGEMLTLIAEAFPERTVHGVGDRAYHGKGVRPNATGGSSWTTRPSTNAKFFGPTPPRTGRQGRPRRKGQPLGTVADIATADGLADPGAADSGWHDCRVTRYGRSDTVRIRTVTCLWFGPFDTTSGRLVLIYDPADPDFGVLGLFTTDTDSDETVIVARYAARWSVEVCFSNAKHQMGVGESRNRVAAAVTRTVPFGFVAMSLVQLWYSLVGHDPDDVAARRQQQPWYRSKSAVSFEDMIGKLRRSIIVARVSPGCQYEPDPSIIREYQLAQVAAQAPVPEPAAA
jgi:hypothetical protein